MEINDLLHAAVDSGASDVLLVSGAPPMFRINGDLRPAQLEPMTPPSLEELFAQVLNDDRRARFERQQDVDFSVAVPTLGRFRFNVHQQRNSLAGAIRCIAGEIPRLDQLQIPPVVEDLTRLKNGLVLVTGQTGSGKSTTLAAMIDCINQRDAKHIITPRRSDRISVSACPLRWSNNAKSEPTARVLRPGLKHILRQDPDVILVGEMRDLETIRTALQAAETGHLVLATLHSSSAAGTIDRIIEVFPPDEQAQIRNHLAECLRAIVTQRLLVDTTGQDRIAAAEIMVSIRAIQTSIREATTHLIPGVISTNRRLGMQTMEQAIKELVLNGKVDPHVIDENLQEGTTLSAKAALL